MEKLQELAQSKYLYIVIALVVLLVIFIIVKASKKNKLKKRINEAQIAINALKSHPFAVDIAKMDAIARINDSIKDTATKCKNDFDIIQENIKNIVATLQDANEQLSTNSIKKCQSSLDEVEALLDKTKNITMNLDDVLKAVLNKAVLQRKRINELKGQFHDIKSLVNSKPNDYTFSWEALDKISNEISHKFSEFEAIMDASQYEEAASKAQEIETSIESFNILVAQLPDLIKLAKNDVVNMISELNANYTIVYDSKAYLQHLDIPGNVDDINLQLNKTLNDIKNCQIEDVSNQLIELQGRINSLSAALQQENSAHKELLETKDDCQSTLNNIKNELENIEKDENNPFNRYNLKASKDAFKEVYKEYETNLDAYQALLNTLEGNTIPATTLLMTFKEIQNDIYNLKDSTSNISNIVGESSTKEIRAHELLTKFVVVLNESKASIILSRLPSISKKYDHDIEEAERHINILTDLLNKKVLDMDAIDVEVEVCQNIIINLYKNVNNIIDLSKDIEEFIVYCNKYRPYYSDVDSTLYSAELAYRNGEYTKACKMTANALDKIDAKLSKELLDSINKKLELVKEN